MKKSALNRSEVARVESKVQLRPESLEQRVMRLVQVMPLTKAAISARLGQKKSSDSSIRYPDARAEWMFGAAHPRQTQQQAAEIPDHGKRHGSVTTREGITLCPEKNRRL